MRLSRFARIVKIGIRSLMLHKLRTFLSVLGIIFGVAAVVSMLAIGEGGKRAAVRQIQQLGARNVIVRRVKLSDTQEKEALRKLSLGLTRADARRIRDSVPHIDLVVPVRIVQTALTGLSAFGGAQLTPEVIATTARYIDARALAIKHGRFLCDVDIEQEAKVCVLGYEVANLLGANGKVGGNVRIGDALFRVVGVMEKTQWLKGTRPALNPRNTNKNVIVPVGTGRYLARTPVHYTPLDEIIVKCRETGNVTGVGATVKSVLDHEHHDVQDFEVIVPLELIHQEQETMRQWNRVLGCIAGISLVVGGIGIMNIMLATVSERTREIGIRRAVGASRAHIITQFLVEAILLTTAGGVLGLALGVAGARLVTAYNGWETVVTTWSIVLSLGTSVLVGTFFGLYPAYKAALLDPIDALRYE